MNKKWGKKDDRDDKYEGQMSMFGEDPNMKSLVWRIKVGDPQEPDTPSK